jgi:phenylacetate-CoA ligase
MAELNKKIRDFFYRFRSLQNYYGDDFKEIFAFLWKSRNWDRERICEYKLKRLKALVEHAGKNVPYYRELFKKHGINAAAINSFEDFAKIPILTKNILRENLEQLKADDFKAYNPIRTCTSGTTGHATCLYRSAYQEAFRRAVMWRIYHENGLRFGDLRASVERLWGFNSQAEFYEYDRVENKLIINCYHIVAGNYDKIYSALKKYKPRMIWAHPTILSALCHHIVKKSLSPLDAPLIGVYGEKIYPDMLNIMHKAIPGKFFEYYGNRENSGAAWRNEDDIFHEVSEYCHLEVICGEKSCRAGEQGDLIATSLHNYAVPLIRYQSEDIVEWHGYSDEACNSPGFKLIGGRGKDLLLTRHGLIAPYLPGFCGEYENKLRRFQFKQISLDEVIIKIAPLPVYDYVKDETALLKQFDMVLGRNFKLKIEYVDDIPFTKGGKYPMSVSTLAMEYMQKSQ